MAKADLSITCIQCGNISEGNFKRCLKCRIYNNDAAIKVRARRDANGLCKICGQPREEKAIKSCFNCRIKRNIKKNRNIQEAKKNNNCYRCFKYKSINTNSNKCRMCYFKETARSNGFKSKDWKLLEELLEKQNYRCYYTGDALILGVNTSLEHRNPKLRFPEQVSNLDNVVWCCLDVNLAKRDKTEKEFFEMCNKVVKNFG